MTKIIIKIVKRFKLKCRLVCSSMPRTNVDENIFTCWDLLFCVIGCGKGDTVDDNVDDFDADAGVGRFFNEISSIEDF